MKAKILMIMMAMLLLVVSMVSAFDSGYLIKGNDFVDVTEGENFTYNFNVYDATTGVLVTDAECFTHLFRTDIFDDGTYDSLTYGTFAYKVNQEMNTSGSYALEVRCTDDETNQTIGGYEKIEFDVSKSTRFGLWKPVENWTFPAIYLILCILLIAVALAYESQMLGVLGSVMLIMSYFLVGATSPILFTPLLIVGFLLAFKFATL